LLLLTAVVGVILLCQRQPSDFLLVFLQAFFLAGIEFEGYRAHRLSGRGLQSRDPLDLRSQPSASGCQLLVEQHPKLEASACWAKAASQALVGSVQGTGLSGGEERAARRSPKSRKEAMKPPPFPPCYS